MGGLLLKAYRLRSGCGKVVRENEANLEGKIIECNCFFRQA